MSVRVEPDGRRLVRVDVEVRGSAEEVWDAIATGPGISSWFVPTEIELDPDGRPSRLEVHFGSGMDSEAMVTAWDPPLRFVAESEDFVPGGPPVSTMWTVEPLDNNSCTVRVEHCLFADSDEYDLYLEGTEVGWPAFFRVLQIYMSDYRGQPCALVEAFANTRDSGSAWDRLKDALGLAGATTGQRVGVPKDAPPLAGTVDLVGGPSETPPQARTANNGCRPRLRPPDG